MNPFDFINAINSPKKPNLMVGSNDDVAAEKAYVPFVINRALSYFPETILHANQMNLVPLADNKLQNDYLLNTIRPAKRFAKWVKRENIEELETVKQYYGYSTEKALQVLNILTDDHLLKIKQKLQRGGNHDENRNVS